MRVVSVLKGLSTEAASGCGTTIVCSIHQPSSQIYVSLGTLSNLFLSFFVFFFFFAFELTFDKTVLKIISIKYIQYSFDYICLLAPGGRQVYCGETGKALDFIASYGYHCPAGYNPADCQSQSPPFFLFSGYHQEDVTNRVIEIR